MITTKKTPQTSEEDSDGQTTKVRGERKSQRYMRQTVYKIKLFLEIQEIHRFLL